MPSDKPTPCFSKCLTGSLILSLLTSSHAIGGFHRTESDLGYLFVNKVVDKIVVVLQISKESLAPWFAMIVGCGDTGVTEAVDTIDTANRFLELSAQLGVSMTEKHRLGRCKSCWAP